MQKENQKKFIAKICDNIISNVSHSVDFERLERFYLGEQWEEGEFGSKPVFNIVKRICDYVISTLCSKDFSVSYSFDGAPFSIRNNGIVKSEVKNLSRHISYKFDKEILEKLVFGLVRDAVIYGTGFLYTYWDSRRETGTRYRGEIETVVIDAARVLPYNPRQSDVQKQEYILITGRESQSSLIEESKQHGADCSEELKRIESDNGFYETRTLMFKEGGNVVFAKTVDNIIISYIKTELTNYPLCSFTPIPIKNSFFGKSYVEGMMGNQIYINRSYAMLMKHMGDTAFSKVIYDASRIPEWTSEPGIAIAAHGGGNLSDCVSVVGCGKLEDGYLSLTADIADRTKELYGATETALGNVEPTNTSAIMAVKEASEGQLRGVSILLTSALESQARIWADFVFNYYGYGRRIPLEGGEDILSEFKSINAEFLRCRIHIDDKSKYGSSVALSVLDRLLDCGAISASEYIKRLPDGIIPDKDLLAAHAKAKEKNDRDIKNNDIKEEYYAGE